MPSGNIEGMKATKEMLQFFEACNKDIATVAYLLMKYLFSNTDQVILSEKYHFFKFGFGNEIVSVSSFLKLVCSLDFSVRYIMHVLGDSALLHFNLFCLSVA